MLDLEEPPDLLEQLEPLEESEPMESEAGMLLVHPERGETEETL